MDFTTSPPHPHSPKQQNSNTDQLPPPHTTKSSDLPFRSRPMLRHLFLESPNFQVASPLVTQATNTPDLHSPPLPPPHGHEFFPQFFRFLPPPLFYRVINIHKERCLVSSSPPISLLRCRSSLLSTVIRFPNIGLRGLSRLVIPFILYCFLPDPKPAFIRHRVLLFPRPLSLGSSPDLQLDFTPFLFSGTFSFSPPYLCEGNFLPVHSTLQHPLIGTSFAPEPQPLLQLFTIFLSPSLPPALSLPMFLPTQRLRNPPLSFKPPPLTSYSKLPPSPRPRRQSLASLPLFSPIFFL